MAFSGGAPRIPDNSKAMQDNPEAFKRMDWKKGVQKPRTPNAAENVVEGASSESIATFAEAMDAARTRDRRNPPTPRRWWQFFRRSRS